LIYFVHQFKPEFREAALLDDPVMLEAVTALNRQITSLARVLNSPSVDGMIETTSDIATMTKKEGEKLYIFAANMKNSPARAEFKLRDQFGGITVFDEGRTIAMKEQKWSDEFPGYGVHIYLITRESRKR
jgi:hypothetical protein